VLCQPREGVSPEPAIMRRESVRQERRYGFDIGFINLTAAQSPCRQAVSIEKDHSVERDHFFEFDQA
jgi:hypothetical protein